MARQSVSIFDKVSLGGWLSGDRKAMGYTNAEDFAKAITKKTGYPVSGRTILNLERGKHEPCLSLVLAISYTLYGKLLSPEMVRHIRNSGNGQLAALLAFPEYARSDYRGIVHGDGEVGIYVGGDESGVGGKWIMRPDPLWQGTTESEA